MNIAIPFNGIIPKGEIGINPAYPDLEYKIFTSKIQEDKNHTYLQLEKEIQIDINPQLVNLKFAFMRSKK